MSYPRSMMSPVNVAERSGNGEVDWDAFNSAAYFSHNYGELRADDTAIIEIVADFFDGNPPPSDMGRAIDVGSGANLYPAMVMLPYASQVTLVERSFTNREWLAAELGLPHRSWQLFWKVISAGRSAYAPIKEPMETLHGRVRVERGNVFSLAPERYDVGTMFFVAESITTRTDEFERATRLFVNALRRNAPFAAAFMRHSFGYDVAGKHFPACSINEDDVSRALAPVARNVMIERVTSEGLRPGYDGMIVATGRRK
ncbi:SCO2525 family SAM-dependent methyltransferase [Actinoplanes sp. Pm04-4]|uniref:SCO2525 family SAM-dependent methyltransferase n=1 Tax=Paractinoplanes pyxinae TaxID=2997416 RepID=A0ABT4BF26_9ACTN|nr:SCO2525 family SAM-dependent methyltransferase [Actinoplanes pyxinae]MCY1144552.1 SCO2525 family SAM-dependent methyltransferase [Actinoplanes pyxinae]